MRSVMMWVGIVVGGVLLGRKVWADSVRIPDLATTDLSGIPPSATNMLRQERTSREEQNLASVKKVVQEVVAAESKKKKSNGQRKSSSRSSRKIVQNTLNAIGIKDALAQQQVLLQEVAHLLYQQYQDPVLMEKKISLHIKQMPIKDALASLGKMAGIPLVVDADITGQVNDMRLDDVPLAAALRSLVCSHDPKLALVKDLGVLRVMKLQAAQDMMSMQVSLKRDQELIATVYPIKNAQWNDGLKQRFEKLWQGMVQADGDKQHLYMVFDDVNKKVFVRGRKTQLSELAQFVGEIDIRVPQIRIDARVVSADKDFQESLGVNYSGLYSRRASVQGTDFIGLGPLTTPPDAKNPQPSDTQSYELYKNLIGWSLNLFPAAITPLLKIPFVFGNKDLSTKRLNLSLQAAENRNEIKTISKPSLLVHNDETAEILVG